MDFDDDETVLIWNGINRQIWSLDHVGMGNGDVRKVPYLRLRAKLQPEIERIRFERGAARL
jgi:hypothetical protein